MSVGTDEYCVHEMWAPTCAICRKVEMPSNVADDDFYCGGCDKMVWRGDFVTLKQTFKNGTWRRRRVGECCADTQGEVV